MSITTQARKTHSTEPLLSPDEITIPSNSQHPQIHKKPQGKHQLLKKYKILGGRPLTGSVAISGSKNAALPIFAATLLTDEEVILHNVPLLRDTRTMTQLLENLGKIVKWEGRTVRITANPQFSPSADNLATATSQDSSSKSAGQANKLPAHDESVAHKLATHDESVAHDDSWQNGPAIHAKYEIVKQMRASISVLGPLLARHRHVRVSLPGGCVFGPRPVDLHLRGLSELNADISIHHGDIVAKSRKPRLQGSTLSLMGKFGTSVLATDNVVSAAVLAEGQTIIEHAAREPETMDLLQFLISMGAEIEQTIDEHGWGRLTVTGVRSLHGTEYTIIPDRIEAGTFMAMSCLTESSFSLENVEFAHLITPLEVFQSIGLRWSLDEDEHGVERIKLSPPPLRYAHPYHIITGAYPAFPTDLQPFFVSLGCRLPGESVICDHIYPNRFNHVPELTRMGGDILIEDKCVRIRGGGALEGARVQASDLRSGAALVMAALCAEGESEVRRIYHVERGYEDFPQKLAALGADIHVEDDAIV